MKRFLRKISMTFAAGGLGGIANSLALWYSVSNGITEALGVRMTVPSLTAQWLYPRIVWGGIWGILFVLPLLRRSILVRGLLYSLGPTMVQLLIVFPYVAGKGPLGLQLGTATPLFVLLFNAVWGVTTALWLWMLEE